MAYMSCHEAAHSLPLISQVHSAYLHVARLAGASAGPLGVVFPGHALEIVPRRAQEGIYIQRRLEAVHLESAVNRCRATLILMLYSSGGDCNCRAARRRNPRGIAQTRFTPLEIELEACLQQTKGSSQ